MKYFILSVLITQIIISYQIPTKWSYVWLSVETTTSNEALLKPDLFIERLKRQPSLSGTIDWKYGCEKTYVEFSMFRSIAGTADYKRLPFEMRKQSFSQYINTLYKSTIGPKLALCSNFPQVDNYKPPWEQKVYRFNKCIPSTDDLPTYMLTGYYKIVVNFTGEVDWSVILTLKIENN